MILGKGREKDSEGRRGTEMFDLGSRWGPQGVAAEALPRSGRMGRPAPRWALGVAVLCSALAPQWARSVCLGWRGTESETESERASGATCGKAHGPSAPCLAVAAAPGREPPRSVLSERCCRCGLQPRSLRASAVFDRYRQEWRRGASHSKRAR